MALRAQTLHVNLGNLQLGLERVTIALGKQLAILENHGIASVDDILCRLAKATRGIDVAADGTGTLLCQQGAQVAVLANQLVAGGAVQDDIGTSHRQVVAGRYGCPHIFAYLNAKFHTIAGLEELWL